MNIYGFKRVGTGVNRGGYFHSSFVQGFPELCLLMKRSPADGTSQPMMNPVDTTPIDIKTLPASRSDQQQQLPPSLSSAPFGMEQLFAHVRSYQQPPQEHCSYMANSCDPFGFHTPMAAPDTRHHGLFSMTNSTSVGGALQHQQSNNHNSLFSSSGRITDELSLFADLFSGNDFEEDGFQQRTKKTTTVINTPGTCENVFPQKLHFLLNQAEKEGFNHIISWVNDGAAFKVHDSNAFLKEIMPLWFDQSKYESFRRQLNLYGFQRISRGPSRGVYYHQFFLQSEPSLCESITRPSSSSSSSSTTTSSAREAAPTATSSSSPNKVAC